MFWTTPSAPRRGMREGQRGSSGLSFTSTSVSFQACCERLCRINDQPYLNHTYALSGNFPSRGLVEVLDSISHVSGRSDAIRDVGRPSYTALWSLRDTPRVSSVYVPSPLVRRYIIARSLLTLYTSRDEVHCTRRVYGSPLDAASEHMSQE